MEGTVTIRRRMYVHYVKSCVAKSPSMKKNENFACVKLRTADENFNEQKRAVGNGRLFFRKGKQTIGENTAEASKFDLLLKDPLFLDLRRNDAGVSDSPCNA